MQNTLPNRKQKTDSAFSSQAPMQITKRRKRSEFFSGWFLFSGDLRFRSNTGERGLKTAAMTFRYGLRSDKDCIQIHSTVPCCKRSLKV